MLKQDAPLTADESVIRRDLSYMTRRWHELDVPAMFEVRAFKEHCDPKTAKFAPDWIDDAVSWVADLNRMGYNLYAVRNPIRKTAGPSAKDKDIVAAFFLWADCDDPASAGNVHRFEGPKWSAAVVTGTTPTTRVHTYWELETPCTDLAAWRDMQVRIAAHFGSDSTVVNPSRIMRIGGTVSWPGHKQSRGYVPEVVKLRTEYDEPRRPVTLEQMGRVFPAAQPSLAAQAVAQITAPGGLQIEIESASPSLDRDRAALAASAGQEWHNNVIRLVGSYVARGLSDAEIHALTDPLTLAGYTVEQTRREVQQAIEGARRKGWTPQAAYASPQALQPPAPPPPPDPAFDAPARPTPPLEWFDDVEPAIKHAYIVKGVLSQGAMSVIYGPSNSGKTFFALDLAFHVAIGAKWRGRRVVQCGVLYLAAEGGRGVLNRVAALKEVNGVCDVPLAVRRAGLDLLHSQANLQEVVDLAQAVKDRFPDLPLMIVIDTLSRIMAGGDENSAADMTALIRNIDAVRETTGAHIALVHHTGKDTARGARGHSSLRAATDTEIEVANENGARAAMVTKQRDYQGGETFAFTLKGVSLGFDQDGDEVTSCVIEVQDADEYQATLAQKKGLGGNQKILADTFDQMVAEGLARPNPGGVGMPEPGRFMAVQMDEFRAVAMGKMAASNKRGAFIEAWKALSDGRGLFCAASDLVWRTDRRIK